MANSRNQPANDATHEKQRDEHCISENVIGNYGEADLTGAAQCGLQRPLALFRCNARYSRS